MAGVDVVILDVDGTLIDSNDAHAQAWVDVGRDYGIDIAFDDVRPLIGMGSDKVLPVIAGVEKETSHGKMLADAHGERFRSAYLPTLKALDGARELLERLTHEGVELVVATSASKEDMRAILEHAGLADLIDDRTSSGDVDESKPEPDIVRAALKKVGADAERAVMLGDTPYDIEACVRAGVRCVAFRAGGLWSDTDLHDAVAIYDDPADLLANWDESPLAG